MYMSDSIPTIMRPITPGQSTLPISNPLNNDTNNGGINIVKILLIMGIVVFLTYNLYLYFFEKTDILGKYFGTTGLGISKTANINKKTVNKVSDGTKDTLNVAQRVTGKGLDIIDDGGKFLSKKESPIEKNKNEEKIKKKASYGVRAESSYNSALKKSKTKGGFCYIGTDRTYRSCVKINPGDVCMSNKIYPTMDICVNPNLRR
jgi:hypothetical protein